MPKVQYELIRMAGGLDQITPPLALKPGVLRDAQNFECAPTGGYSRIAGYERYDGRTAPSGASYVICQVTAFTNTPTAGQTLTQTTSGATGVIIALGSNYIVMTKVTGTFDDSHEVHVGGTSIGTATAITVSITSLLAAQYTNLAADQYRADIAAPTGSGAILGVAGLTISGVDYMYCFRANAGNTAVDLWKATTGGWSQITFKNEISFTVGAVATPADGATLTQGGVTATVRRVMTSSGTYAGGTAAGRFIIDDPAGGNFAAGAATLTGGTTCTLTAVQTAITLSVGGKFEFALGNFSGQLGTLRLYGVDGVNRMFEFDGTTLAPITTGITPDQPKHVAVHKNFLFCSVQSSIFYSGVGTPFRWTSTDGGGEIATGDTVTNMIPQPGAQTTGAMTVYGVSNIFTLYGTSAATWNFVTFTIGAGGADYSARNMSQTYALSNSGVASLTTSLNFGNFESADLTNAIQTFIDNERSKISYSSLNRAKSQYRIFFSDGYGLYITVVNGKLLGCMPVLFANTVYCAWEGTKANGNSVSYFGDTAGMVHQLDMGSSFDGADIDATMTLNWSSMRSPRVLKQYRRGSIEMTGSSYASVLFGYALGYGTSNISQPTQVAYASGFVAAPTWDVFTWDSFTWDGSTLFPTEVDMVGTAENVAITISSTTDYIYPFTVNSAIVHYTMRRGLR